MSVSLDRYLELATALEARRGGWTEQAAVQRRAALVLLSVDGPVFELAGRYREFAAAIHAASGMFSSLRGDLRFVVAALAVRANARPSEFVPALEETRRRFREARLPRGGLHEVIARALLVAEGARAGTGVVPTFERVRRVKDLLAAMRVHHRFLTGVDDLPVAVLLSAERGSVQDLAARAEAAYVALRARRHSGGDRLQSAAHALGLGGADPEAGALRLDALWALGRARGLRMVSEDLLPLAGLALVSDAAPNELLEEVLRDRDALRGLAPRPSRQLAFELAAGTVALARGAGADGTGLGLFAAVQALVSAQSAAAAAAAAAGAAAAAS